MFRSHTCNELTKDHIGQEVTLSGWVHSRRDHGGVIFIDLRDMFGLTQVTFNTETSAEAHGLADSLRSEFVIKVVGEVVARPEDMVNDKLQTGGIEVMVKQLEILGKSKALPFEIDTDQNVNEEVRLKYRFLDLRRERMKQNLLFRGQVIKFLRDWCYKTGFTEFETPILTASSPEGARDFLVPSRLHPGKFYALPQAPQQYKQLLMMSGFDKYFQIAPCFRDEDPRADRSPGEFYQLDMETSFLTQDEFFTLIEPLFIELSEKFGGGKKVMQQPIPRIPFKQAMLDYGSDKPDIRFEMKIQDVTELVAGSEFKVFGDAVKDGNVVRCLVAPGASDFTRSTIDELTEFAQSLGAKGLAYIVLEKDGTLKSPIIKFLGEDLAKKIIGQVGASSGDIVFFGADKESAVTTVLGQVRLQLGEKLDLIDKNLLAWAWIVDFPMFEYDEQKKKIDFGHNPFSMPQGGMKALEEEDPLDVLAYQYDIVCNGVELSSGAVRNYDREIMYKAFGLVGYSKKDVDTEFSAMLSAFDYGAPPTCGFAPGVERMIMVLRDEPNIREITAFPKNGKAEDVMMAAPAEVKPEQLKELGIKLDIKK